MKKLYDEVNKILDSVDFEAIWHGFKKFSFALYNDDTVYFQDKSIPHDNRFLGNTSIDFKGELVAIWNVENPLDEDTQMLAANLIHEMFHAFQSQQGESRYPNDLVILDYPDNLENYEVKHSENLLLVRAFKSGTPQDRTDCLNQFVSARLFREDLIGDIINQEYYTETIEGMAEYAGLTALRQISPEKYESQIEKHLANLESADERFFNIRRMAYYSGSLFLVLSAELGRNIFHEIGKTDIPVFHLLKGSREKKCPPITLNGSQLTAEAAKHAAHKKSLFDEFLLAHKTEVAFDSFICGYDPMNMIKTGNMILCSRFVMLKSAADNSAPAFIQGPVLVKLKDGSPRAVLSYIK